jgi:hypothetical protein
MGTKWAQIEKWAQNGHNFFCSVVPRFARFGLVLPVRAHFSFREQVHGG